jgi:hypothetical protein
VGVQRPRIEAVPMAGGPRRVVVEDAGYALTTMPGRLLFQRSGSIYSMRFDPERAEVSGPAVKLTDEARDSPTGGVAADVNPGGDVLFADTRVFKRPADMGVAWRRRAADSGAVAVVQQPARLSGRPHGCLLRRVRDLDGRH